MPDEPLSEPPFDQRVPLESFIDDLRRLHAAAPPLDAVALAYAAGRRSARAATWRWRGVAGMAVLASGVGWATQVRTTGLADRPTVGTEIRIADAMPIAPPSPLSSPSPLPPPPDVSSVFVFRQRKPEPETDGIFSASPTPPERFLRINDLLPGGG